MRSPSAAWGRLVAKEWSELLRSPSWWVFLLLMGPLVGVTFASAVRTYGELSGLGGTATGVGEAFTPLLGIWAPTFSACEIAATFLLPFVAIRALSADKHSGALKLELQRPMPSIARIAAKATALFVAWIIALLAPALAILLWKGYGGHVYGPELLTVIAGHLLNAGLIIAIALAAASIVDQAATAAIGTLAITVGTWILSFIAAVHGGIWERISAYTPTAIVAEFQHGLIRLNVVMIALTLIGLGAGVAAIWLRIGKHVRRRTFETVALSILAAATILAESHLSASWDTSEARLNSFSPAEERALLHIDSPLHIEAHLATADPRRFDLERTLVKLRRIMPQLNVDYVAATSVGLFEQSDLHYGEIHYRLDGREESGRATTQEAVLESIFMLSGVALQADTAEDVFRGHPLAAQPTGAALVFFGLWPTVVLACAIFTLRRRNHA